MTPIGVGLGFLLGAGLCCATTVAFLVAQMVLAYRDKLRVRKMELDMLYRDFISQEDCEVLTSAAKERNAWSSGSTKHVWHV